MARQEQARLQLLDAHQRHIGEMVLERSEEKLLFGKFTPGRAFAEVQPLFREFEEAANCQALRKVDELDVAIDALGLHLRSPDGSQEFAIKDVQIWSDAGISCRLSDPAHAEVNGSLVPMPSQVPQA